MRTSKPRSPLAARIGTEWRVFFWILSCAVPPVIGLALLFHYVRPPWGVVIASGILVCAWVAAVARMVKQRLVHHFRTLGNLLESIRKGDYAMRSSRAGEAGELASLYQQINHLSDSLKSSRLIEQELLTVLEKVVNQINVAVFVFDPREKIRLVNRLGAALLNSSPDLLIGARRSETALADLPVAAAGKVFDHRFPGAAGRWQVRESLYRRGGEVSRILFIADLKQVLSDEEISAWQRLIRVISHEVNNSLTPISSLCQTLARALADPGKIDDNDVREGLAAIGERARGLQEFISAYARIAQLPEPNKALFPVAELAGPLPHFFAGRPLQVVPFPPATVYGDVVHLQQALINLVKNGLEANPPDAPPVELRCTVEAAYCHFEVTDHGPGIANPDNVFVPFYTTKSDGAGVGLALCRQIAIKHHGSVSLENRGDARGAVARLSLPLPLVQPADGRAES